MSDICPSIINNIKFLQKRSNLRNERKDPNRHIVNFCSITDILWVEELNMNNPQIAFHEGKFKNINWSDVQRKNVVNNVDLSSLRAPWQNGPYKNKHTEQHKNTQNTKTQQTFRKNYSVVFFRIFLFLFFIYDTLEIIVLAPNPMVYPRQF